jgi:rhomboid protease GluP
MCSNCRALVTTDDKACPYCGHRLAARAIDLRMPDDVLGGLIPHARFVTTLLLMVNSAIYAGLVFVSGQAGNENSLISIDSRTLILYGANFAPAVAAGQWWRLITAGFLHLGLLHIAMNSWALFDIGGHLEELFGAGRMAAIYVISTFTGFFASFYVSGSFSAGASAGIFGLIGAMIAFGVQFRRSSIAQSVKSLYVRYAVYGLALGFLGLFPMDNWAHLGGLAGGFGVAMLSGIENRDGGLQDRAWNWAGAVCAVAVAAAFALLIQRVISL